VLNPSDVGSKNPIPATLILGYPMSHPLNPATSANSLLSRADRIVGVAFPQGSCSVLFFGRHGMGDYCYGEGCNDPDDPYKGVHAYPYRSQVWPYDANDLTAVNDDFDGELRPTDGHNSRDLGADEILQKNR
jgi:hypothetical protein